MVIARGSVFECVAILEYLVEMKEISEKSFTEYVDRLDEISRILFALIRKLDKTQ